MLRILSVETLRVGIPPGKAGPSSRKRVLCAVMGGQAWHGMARSSLAAGSESCVQ